MVGQGIETSVHAYSRGSQTGQGVIKGYDQTSQPGFNPAGFDRAVRDRLYSNYIMLLATYGDIIPRQHFLRRHLKTEQYKLVQTKIDIAKPASVLDYAVGALPERAQQQIERIVPILEEEFVKAANPDKTIAEGATPLDLRNPNNLVVSEDGAAYYVDTGLMNQQDYTGEDYFRWKQRLAPLAILKLIARRPATEVLVNPLFVPLIKRLASHHGFNRAQAEMDPTYLYKALKSFYDKRG
jgi:hypothetical protein